MTTCFRHKGGLEAPLMPGLNPWHAGGVLASRPALFFPVRVCVRACAGRVCSAKRLRAVFVRACAQSVPDQLRG